MDFFHGLAHGQHMCTQHALSETADFGANELLRAETVSPACILICADNRENPEHVTGMIAKGCVSLSAC